MANFTTHIAVGTIVSGAVATLTLAADVVAPENLIAVTLAGVLGSVLPDIDLKDSRPSRAMFAGLAVFFSFAVLFTEATRLSIAELWILWLGTLAFVRYGLHKIFHKLSVHRGIWHSILAAIFSSVATAVVFYHLLGKPEGVAWLAAVFMFIGFLTHLVLDEIYSVDVMDTRIKASFGTALKFFDRRHLRASVAMAAAVVGAIMLSPSTATFVEGLTSRSMWSGLEQKMLPSGKWFGVVSPLHFASQKKPEAEAVTTGSISAPEKSAAAPSADAEPAHQDTPAPAVQISPDDAPEPADTLQDQAVHSDEPSGSSAP